MLFEAENDSGLMYGFTNNYIKVTVPYREDWVNTLRTIRLEVFSSFGYVKSAQQEKVVV